MIDERLSELGAFLCWWNSLMWLVKEAQASVSVTEKLEKGQRNFQCNDS